MIKEEKIFRLEQDSKLGVVVGCRDVEISDAFEDFLTEQNYVLFNLKFEDEEVLFFFGQASSLEIVEKLIEKFLSELPITAAS